MLQVPKMCLPSAFYMYRTTTNALQVAQFVLVLVASPPIVCNQRKHSSQVFQLVYKQCDQPLVVNKADDKDNSLSFAIIPD